MGLRFTAALFLFFGVLAPASAVAGDDDFAVVVTEDVFVSPSEKQWNDWLADPFQGDESIWVTDGNTLRRLLRAKGVSEDVIAEAIKAYGVRAKSFCA